MSMQELWEKALEATEILRPRVQSLQTFERTTLSYLFLAESAINAGDTVIRRGEVYVEKPSLVLPSNSPQFEGFDFGLDPEFNQDLFTNYLYLRGITFPSMKYQNKTESLDLFEGNLSGAIKYHRHRLEREENVTTGLVKGPEECWQLSVLIYICSQIARSAEGDIKKLLERYRRRRFS